MKKWLVIVLSVLVLAGAVVALSACGNGMDPSPAEEEGPYRIIYFSNSDGTCEVVDIILNSDYKEPFELVIPEKSPDGDTVVAIRSFGNLVPVPEIILKEDFEELIATLPKGWEEMSEEEKDKYNLEYSADKFRSNYFEFDFAALSEREKESLLEYSAFGAMLRALDLQIPLDKLPAISFLVTFNENMEAMLFLQNFMVERGYTSKQADVYLQHLIETVVRKNNEDEDRIAQIFSGGRSVVANCTKVTISDTVTEIGDRTFAFYDFVETVTLPQNLQTIGDGALIGCRSLVSVTIPEGVTSIGDYTFAGCTGLTSVTIPEGVEHIGESAFAGCPCVETVDGVLYVGDWVIGYEPGLRNAVLRDGTKGIADHAFRNCTGLASVAIPEGVVSIGYYTFAGCTGLTSVTIPEGVTSIGGHAFYGCESLASVSIPEGVTSIGDCAFYGCESLASATIPEGVTSIGDCAFSDCTSLATVTIPASVTSIGDYAFSGCWSLATVTMQEGVTSIGDCAFSGCTSLATVTIPASVTSIGDYAFSGCTSLASVTMQEGVTSIGDRAFAYCWSLASVTIPASVTSIGYGAFSGCPCVETVDGIMYVGAWAVGGEPGLEQAVLRAGTKGIGNDAFRDCTSLASVSIPASVTSIGEGAFGDSGSIIIGGITERDVPIDVTFAGTKAQWSALGVHANTIVVHCLDGDFEQ